MFTSVVRLPVPPCHLFAFQVMEMMRCRKSHLFVGILYNASSPLLGRSQKAMGAKYVRGPLQATGNCFHVDTYEPPVKQQTQAYRLQEIVSCGRNGFEKTGLR